MTKLNYLLGGFLISSTLFFSSCGEKSQTESLKNSPEFNIISSVKNPAGFFSIDVMDLLKKSNIKESKEMPAQFKMLVNTQIDQHFNSENQGFVLEGNIPFVISTTEEGKFNYLMSIFDVIDSEKIGASLCLYFDGKVEKNESTSSLDVAIPGSPLKGTFSWDSEKMILVITEEANSKKIAGDLLASKIIDGNQNDQISSFLAQDNDMSSLLYMDTYTIMANHFNHSEMDEDLIAAYKGMTMINKGNFNNGSIHFESDLDGDNFINSEFNNINNKPINADFNNYISENGQLIAYGGASLNLKAIENVVKHTKYEHNQYEEELSKMGFSLENLSEIFNGDYSASFMDIESVPTEGYEGNVAFNQERPKFLLTCGLKNADKAIELLSNNDKIKIVNNYFLVDDTYIGVHNDKLFVSLTENLIGKVVNGEKLVPYKTEFKTPLKGEFITDINKLPEGFKTMLLKNNGEEAIKFINQMESVHFEGDINHTEFKVEFTDQTKNSFEILSNSVLKNILPLVLNGMI